jgi:hypothetical protein
MVKWQALKKAFICVHILGGIQRRDIGLESYENCMHEIKVDLLTRGCHVRNNQHISQKVISHNKRLAKFIRIDCRSYQQPRKKYKVPPVQAEMGHEGSRMLILPGLPDSRHMKVARLSALRTRHFYPQESSLVLIPLRGWIHPRTIFQQEGSGQWKFSKAPSGNEPATRACTAVPQPAVLSRTRHVIPMASKYWLREMWGFIYSSTQLEPEALGMGEKVFASASVGTLT